MGLLFFLFAGWPAVLLVVVLSVIGLFRGNYRLVVLASVLACPFTWILSGFPVIRSPIFLSPLLLFGAAFALRLRHEMIAWLLAVPFYLIVLLLLYLSLA